MKYLYLHGLGQTAESWNKVTRATEMADNSVCLDLAEMVKCKAATYSNLYSTLSEMCNAEKEDIILCGLSLGGVLALNYAIDYPQKVKALVLIAAQYKMPTRLLKLQNALFRFMPQSMFQQTGFGKPDFISLCNLNSRKINQRIFFLMIMFKIIFVLWHAQNFLTTCRMRCMC